MVPLTQDEINRCAEDAAGFSNKIHVGFEPFASIFLHLLQTKHAEKNSPRSING